MIHNFKMLIRFESFQNMFVSRKEKNKVNYLASYNGFDFAFKAEEIVLLALEGAVIANQATLYSFHTSSGFIFDLPFEDNCRCNFEIFEFPP